MVIPFLSEKGIGFTCGDKTSENVKFYVIWNDIEVNLF